jgi:hypothetical protein
VRAYFEKGRRKNAMKNAFIAGGSVQRIIDTAASDSEFSGTVEIDGIVLDISLLQQKSPAKQGAKVLLDPTPTTDAVTKDVQVASGEVRHEV